MVQLFLDPYLSYEGFFDFAAAQRLLFDFLNSNLNASCFMASKLYLAVRTFAQVCLSRLDKL